MLFRLLVTINHQTFFFINFITQKNLLSIMLLNKNTTKIIKLLLNKKSI